MKSPTSFFSILWTPGQKRITIPLAGVPDDVASRVEAALSRSPQMQGQVKNRGIKIERRSQEAVQRGAFAPVFYGIIYPDGDGSQLTGHFQLHPVARLYLVAWLGFSGLLALALLIAGGLRATPESTVWDALPYALTGLLPFIGLGIVRWQRQRGQADERAIRDWLESLRNEPIQPTMNDESTQETYQ